MIKKSERNACGTPGRYIDGLFIKKTPVVCRGIILLLLSAFILLVISDARAEGNDEGESGSTSLPEWTERLRLSGTVEGDFTWTSHSDTGDAGSGSNSDAFISTVELGAEAEIGECIMANLLFVVEDFGTADASDIFVDELFFTFKKDEFPLYLVYGRKALPFGVFENHLVNDPMTQDAYETNDVGLTVGVSGPMDLDVSATLYRGEEMMAHLFESELFDSDTVAREAQPAHYEISSYMVSASVSPVVEALTVFGSLISEPGFGSRNNTIDVGASVEIKGLRLDAEYIKAVDREHYAGFNREFKESVVSVSAAYEFVLREREVIGGALFSERRAHIVSEPLEIAVRFEHFDDDGIAEASATWSVENRYSAGARFSFYNDEESGMAAYVAAEYRHTDFRLHSSLAGVAVDDNNEIVTRLGFTF